MARHNRRRWPRLQILGDLHGQVVSLDMPISVTEISLGGFAMETTCEFPPGAVHEFRLTFNDESVTLRARVVFCRRGYAPGDSSIYVTGLEFVDHPSDGRSAVTDLIDKIASVLSFHSS